MQASRRTSRRSNPRREICQTSFYNLFGYIIIGTVAIDYASKGKLVRPDGSETTITQPTASFLRCVRRLLIAGFVAVCLAACAATPLAAADNASAPSTSSVRETVAVAYYEDGDYMHKNADGTYTGFNIDYLERIGAYAGWTYEYVDFDTWEEAYAAAESGEVDILPSVYYDSSRDEDMLFSDMPVCSIYTTINVRMDDDRYAYNDYEAFEGMKTGVIAEGKDAQTFVDYCGKHGFSVEIVPYGETADLIEALEQGDLDAMAITYLGNKTQFKTVAQFSPEPLYIAVSRSEAGLKNELDDAMDELAVRDPSYFITLYDTYFGINTNQDPVFTRDEYDYMKDAPTLTVAYDSFRAPLSFTDPSTGEFAGVAALLFDDIAQITGLRFDFVPVESHADAIAMVEAGEVDIVYSVDQSIEIATTGTILATGPYLSDPMAKVVGNNPAGTRIALPEGFSLSELIEEQSPEYEVSYYQTPKLCFDAILDGKADIAYADVHVADYLLAEQQYESLNLLSFTDYANKMAIGVSASSDPRLASVLDRCVQFVSNSKMNQWITETALSPHPATPVDILRQYPLQIILGSFALLVGAICVLVYIYRSKARNAERITRLVYVDPLTEGWNLNRFQIEAAKAIAEGADHDHAVLFFDISRFKSFNAAFGYAEGDRLLIAMSKLLDRYVGEGEFVARVSADQFVALLHWTDMASFSQRFERLDSEINDLPILKNHSYRVLAFGGIAVVEAGTEPKKTSISEFIDCARYARESIGDASHSTVALYTADMKERDIAQRILQSEAVTALAQGEFVAYYQPKVAICTNKVIGLEALVRWSVPEKGVRSPAEFVDLFERNGFITEIDFHMFREACAYIRSRIDAGRPIVPIACNFSRLHLLDDRFPSTLQRIVDEYRVPVDMLELELTESIVMEDLVRAEAMCRNLKQIGFRIAIDDFGSGYSSLGALQELPIDILKLDQSFLLNAGDESRNRTILEGIIDIAERLGTEIVVEGIETEDQAALIKAMDPQAIAQGFLYSRPVAREIVDRLLDDGFIEPHQEA